MPYAVVIDQATTMEDYRKVLDVLGSEPPAGRLVHAVGEYQGGLRFIDIWESRDQADAFARDRLMPAFTKVFGGPVGAPQMAPLDVEDFAVEG